MALTRVLGRNLFGIPNFFASLTTPGLFAVLIPLRSGGNSAVARAALLANDAEFSVSNRFRNHSTSVRGIRASTGQVSKTSRQLAASGEVAQFSSESSEFAPSSGGFACIDDADTIERQYGGVGAWVEDPVMVLASLIVLPGSSTRGLVTTPRNLGGTSAAEGTRGFGQFFGEVVYNLLARSE